MAAAAVQARQLALQISGNSLYDLMEIDGELQADTAIVPAIARIKEANRPSAWWQDGPMCLFSPI